MRLPEIAVKRPVATAMAFLAVLIVGVVAFTRLPLDIMPELEMPSLTVITVYPGASAEEVEQDVTKVIEALLAGTENLKEIKSQSKENVSFITMIFDWNSDIESSTNSARDLLDLLGNRLPAQARKPMLFKINSNMLPVLMYGMTAKESYSELEHIVNDKIADPIRRVPGVGTLITIGTPKQEYRVTVSPEKLRGYNLSIAQLATILKGQSLSIPGGNIDVGENSFAVRIPANVNSLETLKNTQVSILGQGVKLRDVAEVSLTTEEMTAVAQSLHGQGAAVMIQKQSGENTLEVAKRVRAKMEEVRKTLPPDVEINEVMFADEVVRESISGLSSSLLYSLIFVVLVVLAMLRDWRQSFIVVLTIPFSLITALILMFVIGWSINIFSLMSLIIAMGMVVDNAIVVLENINQHIERGAGRNEAAMFGASEMGSAIIASTLTTLMVFLPMVFMGGIVGVLFKQLAVLVSVTLIASLVTALALTPMVSSKMLLTAKSRKNRKHGPLYRLSENIFVWLEDVYSNVLKWTVHHKAVTLLIALLLFIGSLFLAKVVGTDYIPAMDAGDVAVNIQLEVSASVEKTDSVTREVMKLFEEHVPEMLPGTLASIAGQTSDGALTAVGFKEGKNIGTILCHLVLPNERTRSAEEIAREMGKLVAKIPEVQNYKIMGGSVLSTAVQGNKSPIEINVYGSSLATINATAQMLADSLKARGGFADIITTRDPGKLEILVDIDEDKASSMMLNSGLIGLQVRQALYGTEGGKISSDGNTRRIYLRYEEGASDKVEDVKNILITNLAGTKVKLGAVADVKLGQGVLQIDREAQQRIVRVKANLDNIPLGDAAKIAEDIIATSDIPDGVVVETAGQIKEQESAFSSLYLMLVLGILMVYMVMAGQFESFVDPFIIMMAVPLTIIGVILAFFVTNTTLSVSAFIGIIMLVGIVVNNGIVLIDYIKLLRKRGYDLETAVREAGRSRLRPVLMTSLTTMLGMLPMALSVDMGREIYSPLGITMIGGLLVSTFITLLVVPTFYAAIHRREKAIEGMLKRNVEE
ncbi:MAG: acriflavine resistance protein B [Bacteroidetes bacterium]|nr:MAG: acriflavine resistance protein B [Bacteroidota bacterium]